MSLGPGLLVIGRTGQLARALAETAPKARFWGREAADLTDPAAVEAAVAASGARVVVNAAAYTAVDRAESEPDLALTVNGHAAGAIARGAAAAGAAVVQVSTDYVFDGSKPGEWTETDPVAPLGAYGRSKLEGEVQVAAATPRHVILRTAWVHAPWGHNFVRTMLRLGAERDRLTVVADQHGKPTSALDIAEAIAAIAPRLARAAPSDPAFGVFHYAGAGATHWAGFAREIFRLAEGRLIARAPEVAGIATADYPTPARRPANSALDCGKFERVFGLTCTPWPAALARVIDRIEADAKGTP